MLSVLFAVALSPCNSGKHGETRTDKKPRRRLRNAGDLIYEAPEKRGGCTVTMLLKVRVK